MVQGLLRGISIVSACMCFLIQAGCSQNSQPNRLSSSGREDIRSFLGEASGQATKYPILYVNGMVSSGSTLEPVLEALRKDGHTVYLSHIPAAHSLKKRAESLQPFVDEILAETGAEKINLIGYSLGALDSRRLVALSAYESKVASISSISGPNLGTPIGTKSYQIMKSLPEDWRTMVDQLFGALGVRTLNPLLADPELMELAYDLSLEGVAAFNQEHPLRENIYYQSFAALSTPKGQVLEGTEAICGQIMTGNNRADIMNPGLLATMKLLGPSLQSQPSDGAISVESQKLGNFRGCIPTDHWGVIGSERRPGVDPRTGFDLIHFYRQLAFDLSHRGF